MENAGKITTYKGFNKDWTCRGFQYSVGGNYHTDRAAVCLTGFHACKNPIDVLRYYHNYDSRYAVVEQTGILAYSNEHTKVASSDIRVKGEISCSQLCMEGINYIHRQCLASDPHGSQITWETAILNYGSNLARFGQGLDIITHGRYNKSASMGRQRILHTSGIGNELAVIGSENTVTSSGEESVVAVQGESSQISIAGSDNTSISMGNYSRVSVSGMYNTLLCIGDRSYGAASGDGNILDVHGTGSIAMAAGLDCRASAGENGAFALAWMDGDQVRITVGIVGENGIKPDVLYRVGPKGVLVEART